MAAAGCSTLLPRAAQLFAKKCFLVPSLRSNRCLSVGKVASIERTFTQADVETFAALTGDDNPIHLNPAYAQSRSFPACVVHGALINGLVSAVIGTKLPGPGCVVVHQVLVFPKPLFVGESVCARVQVKAVRKSIVQCTYECKAGPDKVVMSGEVKLFVRSYNNVASEWSKRLNGEMNLESHWLCNRLFLFSELLTLLASQKAALDES